MTDMYLLALFLLFTASTTALAEPLSVGAPLEISGFYGIGDQYQKIRLLGALSLSGNDKLAELSGLAWDEDEQLLYAVSDQGRVLHLQPVFENGQLSDIQLIASFRLRDASDKKFKDKQADSEGLNIVNGDNGVRADSRLMISFERDHRLLLTSTEGKQIKEIPLPAPLDRSSAFRGKNDGIEGFMLHPTLGTLLAAEKPLKGDDQIRLISEAGLSWFLPTLEKGGGVVAMDMDPMGGIIVMERAVTSIIRPWTITLYRVHPSLDNQGESLQPELLARMNSGEDWYVQNLEGLTHVKDRRYFMVSDDGDSFWQQTQLIYFEIVDQ